MSKNTSIANDAESDNNTDTAKDLDDLNKAIARRVLRRAARAEGLLGLSDPERLVWMLRLAAKLGAAAERHRHRRECRAAANGPCRPVRP